MNLSIILFWSITILATIALIGYAQIRKRKREKTTLSLLMNLANEHNSKITSYDYWSNTQIGIDKGVNNMLFFLRTTVNKQYKEAIHLSEVKSCRLIRDERTVRYKREKIKITDRILLAIEFKDSLKQDLLLEFYNTDYDRLTLSGELQLAQKWSEIVNCIPESNKMEEKEIKSFKKQDAPSLDITGVRAKLPLFTNKGKLKTLKPDIIL